MEDGLLPGDGDLAGDDAVKGWGISNKSRDSERAADVAIDDQLAEAARGPSPFVLLEDQRNGAATLFTKPVRIFRADTADQFADTLDAARRAIDDGATLAGFVSYRAGALLQRVGRASARSPEDRSLAPLLWWGEFDRRVDGVIEGKVIDNGPVAVRPMIRRGEYEAMVRAAVERIMAGDIYQVNLTFPMSVEIDDALRYYLSARRRSGAAFGAFLGTGDRQILSFSPELFFRLGGGTIETRPMKGTRRRGASPARDCRLERSLASDPKDRAENLMIVDLLRNDLSRVCVPGSVVVPHLFRIERYPTVWQMTSTVCGRIRASHSSLDVLEALFPCGSITGAPKIMAMRVITELESPERGVYTGAMGFISRDEAVLNVAIRTIDLAEGRGRLNVGAGIVADSKPRSEWLESLSKARFAGEILGSN